MSRIERGEGPVWAVAVAGAQELARNGAPEASTAGPRLRAIRREVGMSQGDFVRYIEGRLRDGGLTLRGRIVAHAGGRTWMCAPGWVSGPALVHGGAIEQLDSPAPEVPGLDHLEPFAARVTHRVLHRKVLRAGHRKPVAWAIDGWLTSRGGDMVARTRTDLDDGIYSVEGKTVEPVPDGPEAPDVLPGEAEGQLGAFVLERPYTDLRRVLRVARPRGGHDRPGLAYLRFEVARDGRTARITGTDGHRMAQNAWRLEGTMSPGRYDWPLTAVRLVLREKRAPRLLVRMDAERVTFANGNTRITTRWERDALPQLEAVIPDRVATVLRFDHQTLADAISGCRQILKTRSGHEGEFVYFYERDGGYLVAPKDDPDHGVFVGAERREGGRVRDDQLGLLMPVRLLTGQGDEEPSFGFQERYLYDFLRHTSGPELYLGHNGPQRAFVVYGAPITY